MDCEVEFNAALVFGLFGIAADTLFGELCREDAKFTELHALAIGQGISNAVERELDHGEDFLLCGFCFFG
jgi:hypothetical protein